MVVQHNVTAMNANRMLNVTVASQAKSTEKLSSGYRINRAADDAAGLSISEKMRAQIRGLNQASKNAEDGISFVQTVEGAYAEVSEMLQRLNELAVQASNGTTNGTQDGYIDQEVTALETEIARIGSATKFNGAAAFGTTINLQIGETADTANTLAVTTSAMLTVAVDLSSDSSAKGAITTINGYIETVSSARSALGAIQNRLEHTVKNLDNIAENVTASESRIRDTDMSEEMVKYSNENIIAQAGQAMLAQANQANQGVLSLLQ